jgi:16S rRNA (cytosine967-C5)-methyltransferase
MSAPRARAARAISSVTGKRLSLDKALDDAMGPLQGRDRALVREMAYGVCRHYFELDAILAQLLDKPLKQRDSDVHALLLTGLYQMRHMRVPDHAAVAETVSACKQLGKPWARGLINAVLRGYQSRGSRLLSGLGPAERAAHPAWLFAALRRHWPEQLDSLLEANNSAPPMTLRVNSARISRDDWLARARAAGIEAEPCELAPTGVILGQALDVTLLPGFAEGLVSVQDEAAQLCAELLACSPQDRVLDACSAPGGKTCHLLETYPSIDLIALDNNPERLQRVTQNLSRLQLTASTITGDASEPATWWDGVAFDRILVDAPCSGTGVIRRHPDIKLLRTPQQVQEAAALQQAVLAGVWRCLKPGGLLLYATCSVMPEENEHAIAAFLQHTPDAREDALDVNWGLQREHGRQLLPCVRAHDGFFYARLRKMAAVEENSR